jgi:hypothetical protein
MSEMNIIMWRIVPKEVNAFLILDKVDFICTLCSRCGVEDWN